MIANSTESISHITTPPDKKLFGELLHYWPSLCLRLPLPVFSITVPFCHRQDSKSPLSLWPWITQPNHLRQVLKYSNKPPPDAAETASLLKHLWGLWNDWTWCWSVAVTTVDLWGLADGVQWKRKNKITPVIAVYRLYKQDQACLVLAWQSRLYNEETIF